MTSTADRFSVNTQLEYLHSKYVGTGNPDITKQ